MTDPEKQQSVREKLHSETARIPWAELQRFFAQGSVLHVDDELDLLEIAELIALDDKARVEELMSAGQITAPSNDHARKWYESDASLWSVVVAPFVLVQQKRSGEG